MSEKVLVAMTTAEVLKAFAESDSLADEVLRYLNHGMLDEWDVGLSDGLQLGFGGDELRIAARSALALVTYHQGGE